MNLTKTGPDPILEREADRILGAGYVLRPERNVVRTVRVRGDPETGEVRTVGALEALDPAAPVGRNPIEQLMAHACYGPCIRRGGSHRRLSTWDFAYTHPGALTHRNAIVVGYSCRSCGEWRDRLAIGRIPRYCSGRCRQAAYRLRKAA